MHNNDGLLEKRNLDHIEELVSNFFRGITSNDISEEIALSNLLSLTQTGRFAEAFVSSPKFKEYFNRMKDTTNLDDPLFFNLNADILKNVVNRMSFNNRNGSQNMFNEFHQIPQEDIVMPFIQSIEEQKEGFVEKSVEFLNCYYDVQKSKNLYE